MRRLTEDDAPFILQLLNEPSFLQYIGDKNVRTLNDARAYIQTGPGASYDKHGFGLYLTALENDGTPIGICGLLKRDTLDDVDLGFALLPEFWRQGYALEAARAVLAHGKADFGLTRIVAITSPDNERSGRVLANLGFVFERLIQMPPDDHEVRLYARQENV